MGSTRSNVEGKQHDDTSTHIPPPQASTTRLPSTSIHVLEKVTAVEHVNVQHKVMEQTQLGAREDVHETLDSDIVVTDMEQTAPLPLDTQTVAYTTYDNIMQPVRVTPTQHREVHISRNFQNDLDLWDRIREFDKRIAEEGFTQVLSKKQQQAQKKQVLGKSLYNTRAKGGPSPPTQ